MRRVFWAEKALDDFDDLVAYIADDDPMTALRVLDRIEAAVEALAEMPTGRRGRVAGTYEKVVTGLPYVVAYALGETAAGEGTLTVLRVIHGARNWPEGGWPEP